MDLYPGLLVTKVASNRMAQVAGLDNTYVYLTYDDDGRQTRVRRARFGRRNEWRPVVGYQEEQTTR